MQIAAPIGNFYINSLLPTRALGVGKSENFSLDSVMEMFLTEYAVKEQMLSETLATDRQVDESMTTEVTASMAELDRELSVIETKIRRTRDGMMAFYGIVLMIGILCLLLSDKVPKTVAGAVATMGALGLLGSLNERRSDALD